MKKDKNSTFAGFGKVDSTTNPPKTIKVSMDEKSISVNNLFATVNYLVGKVCTVIDASVTDKEQATAIKQIIKDDMYGATSKVEGWKFDNDLDDSDATPQTAFPFWK